MKPNIKRLRLVPDDAQFGYLMCILYGCVIMRKINKSDEEVDGPREGEESGKPEAGEKVTRIWRSQPVDMQTPVSLSILRQYVW